MAEILRIVGGIAGLGGLGVGVLLLVYRDLARDLIQRRAFRMLTNAQATLLLGAAIAFTFGIAILGIFAGLASSQGAWRFVVLVALFLVFLLVGLWLLLPWRGDSRTADGATPTEPSLVRVGRLIDEGQLDAAARMLSGLAAAGDASTEYWCLKARLAQAHGNWAGALSYVDKALETDPRDDLATALKLRILILNGDRARRRQARDLAIQSRGLSPFLDTWLISLEAEGMLSGGPLSTIQLDEKCPFPRRS